MTPKFLATTELGRLSKWLRILGYDVDYCTSCQKSDLFLRSLREDRIILTRNLKLSKPTSQKVLFIISTDYKKQLRQVIEALNLKIDRSKMFSRCVICNEHLKNVSKKKVKNGVPPYVFKTHEDFMQCGRCQRIYWSGTHWRNIDKAFEEILNK
jgi:hypothetical protein